MSGCNGRHSRVLAHRAIRSGGNDAKREQSTACASNGCAGLERARLLHHYPLHRASADAQRLADLQYARAALVEAQDARCSSALRSPCFLLVLDDFHEAE